MGNIIIAIKRFFQNKNTVTILALLVSVGIIYFAYNYRIKKSTEPINVPYAVKEIGPRTEITKDMVSVKKVPGGIITKDVMVSISDIVGKYTLNTVVIPEGSIFYKSTIVTWDELPGLFDNMKYTQTVATIPVNSVSTNGNSIFPGNYIDVYFRTNKTENGQNKVWIGKFIEGIRVLDVVDENGRGVFETNGAPRQPALLQFNLSEEGFLLFEKIKSIGLGIELFPVQRNANYKPEGENNDGMGRIVGEEFKQYVLSYTVDQDTANGGKK